MDSSSALLDCDSWDTHWEQYAQSAEANPAQRYRRRLIFSWLDLPTSQPVRVLDIGSGQGDFAADLKRAFPQAEILGLELSHRGVEISKKKVPEGIFQEVDLLQPSFPPEHFQEWASHAVCSEVLEHLDDPRRLLANVRPYLRKGCKLIVTVPGGPMSHFDRHIGHRKHYTPGELRALLESAGYEVEWAGGAGFPFFNLYRLLVITRGKRLVRDVSSQGSGGISFLARCAMRIFRILFLFNFGICPWGWQIIALARNPS
jgi:SAM-dependent methyltransferase